MKGANTGRRRGAIISSTMTPIRGSLAPFLDPASVAVIGPSRDRFKFGGAVGANRRSASFAGRIVPINSRASTVQGLPSAPRLQDVEGAVDLAVIAVPAVDVLSALVQCVAKGVGGAVVISAGFRETGGEGARREAELRAWLRGQPIRVLGPNCLGSIRAARRRCPRRGAGGPRPRLRRGARGGGRPPRRARRGAVRRRAGARQPASAAGRSLGGGAQGGRARLRPPSRGGRGGFPQGAARR